MTRRRASVAGRCGHRDTLCLLFWDYEMKFDDGQYLPGPLWLYGCAHCGTAFPYPGVTFNHLPLPFQRAVVDLAALHGYTWDTATYPLTHG